MNRILFACVPASIIAMAACTHSQAVTLTSAKTDVAPPKTEGAAPSAATATTGSADLASAPKDGGVEAVQLVAPPDDSTLAAAPKDAGPHVMSFEELSAALGDDKITLAIDRNEAPASKGLDSNGYSAVGAVHQAAADGVRHGTELQVSGGITAAAVRSVVHDNASRLRVCYERALQADPRLAGRVTVSFSIDARGAVENVDSQSDTLPAEVTSCVSAVFGSVTFSAPKAPPAKVVVPVDFNKDS